MLKIPRSVQIATYHINPVQQPKDAASTLNEGLNDTICGAILGSAAAAIGIPPNAVRFAGLMAAVMKTSPGSESSEFVLRAPTGYVFCRADVKTTSVVPSQGDKASLFAIRAEPTKVVVETWVPRRKLGDGRSWYDGYLTVYFVEEKEATTTSYCGLVEVNKPVSVQCRGAHGGKGLPGCGAMTLGRIGP